MNREEVRALLEMATLKQPDEMNADMQAALEFAGDDLEFCSWYEQRKAFDYAVSTALSEVPAPAFLRNRILQSLSHAPARRSNPRLLWFAAAAVITLLGGTAAFWSHRFGGGPHWEDEALAMVRELDRGRMPLDHSDGNMSAIQSWLAQNKAPAPQSFPQGMSVLATLGCKIVKLAGHPASIICFGMPETNEEAHLVVVDATDARASSPVFQTKDGWNVVTWNENGRSLMLATRAGEAALRNLMA